MRAVVLGDGAIPADLASARGRLRLRVTPEQRTTARPPVSTVDFIDIDEIAAVRSAGASSASLALYEAVTPRLIRVGADARAGTHWFLSFVNGAPGHEAEYDRWYLNHHIHEVLGAPDFVAAQRFTLRRVVHEGVLPAFRFYAAYELQTRDLRASIQALEAYLLSGVMTETPFKDPSRRLQVFAALEGASA